MAKLRMRLSTGLPGLDRVLRGLMPGDNIVWQIDSVEDYLPFVPPYCAQALERQEKVIYFRFAAHRPLITEADGAEVYHLHPERGFEPFLTEIHEVIDRAGRGRFYLFDCLSELAPDWKSDRMLGNFFMLTCPYLYDRAAIAYFALLRNRHSFHALAPISDTTQILINVYQKHDDLYIHPLKVQHRHSGTMYTLHVRRGEDFIPVTQSGAITEVLGQTQWARLDPVSSRLGYWSQTFADAEVIVERLERGEPVQREAREEFDKILHMLVSQEESVLELAKRYLTLRDLLAVRKRMIGTGLIGGKSVGMVLARAILHRENSELARTLEPHDSFFVGSDVFYTYLVQNGYWWMVKRDKHEVLLDDSSETARRRILTGHFPEYIVNQFSDMLEYFGQSPIIVRSSSLLEDNFGTAFAGKYESVFCANQGGLHKRLEDFLSAVRTVYASMMSDEALAYRHQRQLLDKNEQMALLIQRVSGAAYGTLYFPQAAGVGFSVNPYVWHEAIDPAAGVIRLVFGVGTRAVDRSDDDYTRIVALNEPLRRPEPPDEVRTYAQQKVDVLDLEANHLTSMSFEDIYLRKLQLPFGMFASRCLQLERHMLEEGLGSVFSQTLTFEKLLTETDFVRDIREILATLQRAYRHPVDIEFTLNFFDNNRYLINLVQCRPLQIGCSDPDLKAPEEVNKEDVLIESHGAAIGASIAPEVGWFIYVPTSRYSALRDAERYAVARVIGELTHHERLIGESIILVGPGRWGTTTASLGIPVSFSDIANARAVCEVVAMHGTLVPDMSLGTHFFNELVENKMLYFTFLPDQEESFMQTAFFEDPANNSFVELLPEEAKWADVVRVLNLARLRPNTRGRLYADTINQRVLCYFEPQDPSASKTESAAPITLAHSASQTRASGRNKP